MSKPVYLTAALGLLLVQLALAAYAPPMADELYYWCWAKEPQVSYYDHPPLTAYLIWASTSILGDTLFAIRLPACLCMFAVVLLMGKLTRPLWPVALLLATPLCVFGGILMTPDAPLVCLWTAYLVWLADLHMRLDADDIGADWRTWTLGGVLLGLGILSKYTMGLAGGTAALSLLMSRPWRQWVAGFALHGLVAFVVSSPILLYNIQCDFAPLRYQWEHTMEVEAATIRHLPEYVGGQILVMGWLPFTLTPWLIWHWRSLSADPRLRACLWMFLAPFLFFLYKAARDRVELNWPVPCYLAFCPLAAHWLEQMSGRPVMKWLGIAAYAIPTVASAVLIWHLVFPLEILPPIKDRLHTGSGWCSLAHDIDTAIRELDPDAPVFTPTYQNTSYLRFCHVNAHQMPGLSRPSHFTRTPLRLEEQTHFYFVDHHAPNFPGFAPPQVLGTFPLMTRGQSISEYLLVRYERVSSPSRN
ncbi:MAG: glycosyltransferase family 39 protein [Planctomycetes bacterium]|nr:glycosyltransferase family 39 protein [Planctomycetota bacterium]